MALSCVMNNDMYGADRYTLSRDTGSAAATANANSPVSDANLSSVASARSSRQLRRFDSLPDNATSRDVTNRPSHVTLSSTRLLEKWEATINSLTADCRQPGASNHGNGVTDTSDPYDISNSASTDDSTATRIRINPAKNSHINGAKPEISGVEIKDPIDISETVITSSQLDEHRNIEVAGFTQLESPAPLSVETESLTNRSHSTSQTEQQQQQNVDDGLCSDGGDLKLTMDVMLDKGPLGLGFCIDGGVDTPEGPAPITVKRLFKGKSAY